MTIHQFLRALFARRRTVAVTVLVLLLFLGVLLLVVPPKYTATASVVVNSHREDLVLGAASQMPITETYVATQADVIASPRVARMVVKKLKLDQDPKAKQEWQDATAGRGDLVSWLADSLLIGLKVNPGRDSNVLEIDYTSRSAPFAAQVANAFADSYLETNSELKVAPAKQNAHFLDAQMADLRMQLAQAQQRLADAQRASGIVIADDAKMDVETARLSDLSTQLAMAQAQRADSYSRDHGAQGDFGISPDVIQNPVVQQLKAQVAVAESKLKTLSATLGPNHPEYIAAEHELNTLRASLAAESNRVGESLATANRIGAQRVAQLQAAVDAQRQHIIQLSQQRDKLSVLQREVDNAQKAYDMVMQRYSETSLESQVAQPDVALLTPATEPIDPSFPKIKLFVVLTIVLGLLLGAGIALLAEIFNPRVHTSLDVMTQIGVPVFAVIPRGGALARPIARALPNRRRRLLGGAY